MDFNGSGPVFLSPETSSRGLPAKRFSKSSGRNSLILISRKLRRKYPSNRPPLDLGGASVVPGKSGEGAVGTKEGHSAPAKGHSVFGDAVGRALHRFKNVLDDFFRIIFFRIRRRSFLDVALPVFQISAIFSAPGRADLVQKFLRSEPIPKKTSWTYRGRGYKVHALLTNVP